MPSELKRPTVSLPPKGEGLRAVIDEFGRLLHVFSGQVAASLLEADREYAAVGAAFHQLAAAKIQIGAVDCAEPHKSLLGRECGRIGESLHAAVVALQYHDRLAQRLGHIRAGLDHLQTLLCDGTERSNAEWLKLLQNVERAHHVEQQRLLDSGNAAYSTDAAAESASKGTAELF